MGKTEWLVNSGARSHMISVRDRFVSMKELNTTVCITIVGGRKIDTIEMGTVGLKLINGTSVALSDVLYIPELPNERCTEQPVPFHLASMRTPNVNRWAVGELVWVPVSRSCLR
ncbi:unnamed protein product [Phytophthora fragariaefolia]|uniref:Unnamed protein product n=1 Tax=Phytophthora fragariaefolia TaxID=1490495 RepID=A0A9W6WVT9_9STRA|nr:unnamed protein product [Phytophthora fragariaefolia]